MEKSNFSKYVPKYVKGFDVDELAEKACRDAPMTKEEKAAFAEAFRILNKEKTRLFAEQEEEVKKRGGRYITIY